MARFNIRQVEAFRAVVTLGSMTKAAELLGISQPAVSRLIVDFEEAVGFTLFRRARGGAEPTEDARRLFTQVEKLFVGLEELNDHAHSIRSLTAGSVSIAAMDIYANGIVPDLIGAFRALHPGIAIRLESQPHDRIAEWVASRRSDLGFVTLPAANTALPVLTLQSRNALCVLPPGHRLCAQATVHARDLTGENLISFPRGAPFRFEIDALLERAGAEPLRMVEAGTHEATCNLVAAGAGVAIVSPFSPHLNKTDALVFRHFLPAIRLDLGLIADENALSIAALTFFDFTVSRLKTPDLRSAMRSLSTTRI